MGSGRLDASCKSHTHMALGQGPTAITPMGPFPRSAYDSPEARRVVQLPPTSPSPGPETTGYHEAGFLALNPRAQAQPQPLANGLTI